MNQGSSPRGILLQKIVDAVTVLKEHARTHMLQDPLSRVEYHLTMTAPMEQAKNANDIAVKIMVVYLSGHGEESAHVLNDAVSFRVTETAIVDIEFQGEVTEKSDPVSLTDEHLHDFVARVKEYCGRHLSPGIGDQVDGSTV